MGFHDSDTVEDIRPALAAGKYFVNSPADLAFEFGAASHAGKRRSENQDHYIVLRRTRTQQLLLTNMPTEQLMLPTDEAYAMAVADGMGGGGHGALASQVAIRTAWELAGRTTSWIMKLGNLDTRELAERVEAFVYMMQQAFVHEFESNPQFGNSGTTWTSAYFVSSFAVVAQIGDSPSFLWREGILKRVSVIAGKYSHMLTRCLGYESCNARPDVHHLRLRHGDQLLICTDGLTDMVDDARIAACIDDAPNAQSACDGLVALALAAGGRDNVTAVLARAANR
jgi:protein phosphatase